ncbi:sulfatase family protein [Altericroceibacterium xinjiangense]|uniref:sulfatase family protein n=1 Tax=Altericroceibacterium xinjiangense TaxID=762261 RepID=UPI000F7DCB6F|nr:sulfatase [Altericroceibacterium xinjiangense]
MKKLALRICTALTMAFASAPATLAQTPLDAPVTKKSPNVVFILLDDLRFDGMGFLQPGLHTPNIDRLARGGTYFPNTVVTSSLCSPSRATILTGLTARNHGVVDNNDSSEEGLVYFPSYLQQAGYQTAFIGKWHMGSATDMPRAGFDKWVSFAGQGNYFPVVGANGRVNTLNVDGRAVAQQGYLTDELTDYAMNWLQTERASDKPFFLYLSHKAVHSDPLPAPRHQGQYDDHAFNLPASAANTPENYAGKPRWVYDQRNTWHGIDFFYNSDMKMDEYLRYYYSTLSAVDDSVGRILQWLRDSGLERDTLVVFTSDNGYMIGDHGLIDKRTAYEPSVRVPMVMYQPGTVPAGAVNPGRIRNLDFAPTFLEFAGVQRPEYFEGQSARPLITGQVPAEDWHPEDFVYEYYWEWSFPMTPGTFSITRGDLKYIQYYGVYDLEELYDLSEDPREMNNLIDDPAYLDAKIELRRALFEQLADHDGRHVIPYTERAARGIVRRAEGGTRAGDFPSDWYVEPDLPDRLDDLVPDSRAKAEAHARGAALLQVPVLGRSTTVGYAGEAD